MEAEAIVDTALRQVNAKPRQKRPPPPEPAKPIRSYDGADLLSMPMAEPNFVVRSFVPEGVTLWCGRPKVGKTTMLRQLARAVNMRGTFFGERCSAAEVWFLSLEEGERLTRKKLLDMAGSAEDWRGIRFEFESAQGAAGVDALRERLEARVDARPVLIIIDSLQRFRLPQSDRGHAFSQDYDACKLLAELCKDFPGLAIIVLHHTTKAVPDDPVASISGTYGLTAAADSYAILMKQAGRFRLHAGGRLWDRDCSDFELRRQGGEWELIGEWDATPLPSLAPKQQAALEALRSGAKTNRTLAEATGQSPTGLSHLMTKLEEKGFVVRIANGWGLAR